jgi:hypothetical protein
MSVLTNAKLKVLRGAFNALSDIQKQIALLGFGDDGIVEAIHQLVIHTTKRAPGVLPPFNRPEYTGFNEPGVRMFGVRAYVASALSLLSVAIEDEGAITADLLDFAYVSDSRLRAILQRDYRELLRAITGKCWKAAVVLSGGIIEALLADQLLRDIPKATCARSAPKKNLDIPSWRFVELINVAVETGIVSKGAEKLSHSVREYRNLVHLHKELKDNLRADEHEARIALNVLQLVDRDLQP